MLAAWDGEGIVGLRQESGVKDAHKAVLWGLSVDVDYGRRGVAAELVAAALRAPPGSVEQVMLSVTAENGAAIRLYERFGFVAYGTEPRALKTATGYCDELLMMAFLDGERIGRAAEFVSASAETAPV